MMARAIRIYQHGGPEVLRCEQVEVGTPGEQEVLVRHTAIGINFADVYLRIGLYPQPLPSGMGSEAAGVIEAIGRKVRGFKPGDRVAYSYPVAGAYSEHRVLPAGALIRIPAGVDAEQVAAVLLKGMTCWFLLRQTYKVGRGDVVLVPAAAGGVGLILCQWARSLGAKVIGVVGSPDKATLAKRNGCHQVLVGYEDMAARVRKLNRGAGVAVVYDGVGRDTQQASLDSLKPRGMLVSFGNASGPAAPLAPSELAKRGSLFFTRSRMADYVATAETRQTASRELFALMRRKSLRVHIGQRYALAEAAQAQRDLESRRTFGSSVLVP
ncbi:MAG TPA: quinone oxidoreductase [Steroidobacteraceae bacterium]|jgi:NADPH2:quinone reductase|nr:quinone oxidoreductase [Steroidobacteraceae bacterium]